MGVVVDDLKAIVDKCLLKDGRKLVVFGGDERVFLQVKKDGPRRASEDSGLKTNSHI